MNPVNYGKYSRRCPVHSIGLNLTGPWAFDEASRAAWPVLRCFACAEEMKKFNWTTTGEPTP